MKGNGMVSKSLFVVFLVCALVPACLAQAIDYNRIEVYGGYSRARVKSTVDSLAFDSAAAGSGVFTNLCSSATGEMLGTNSQQFFCKGRGFDGLDISGTYNLNRYVGIQGNITATSRSERFVDDFGGIIQTTEVKEHLYSALAGVQLKDNSTNGRRVRPFGHALIGISQYKDRTRQTVDVFPDFNFVADDRDTSLAIKLGGGVDIQLSPRVDLRVIEIDYHPVFAGDRGLKTISGPFKFHVTGKTAQNYTVGFGIVIH
jgi:opacity protein-like surface antigen